MHYFVFQINVVLVFTFKVQLEKYLLKLFLFSLFIRVLDVLNNISMRNVALDMDRLNTLIHRAILEEMNEVSPNYVVEV